MSNITIRKVPTTTDRALPVFAEYDEIIDRIRDRAYKLFQDRGLRQGLELEDWLSAEREICCPAAKLVEREADFQLDLALAGFESKDITVTANPHELIIKAAKKVKQKASSADETVRWSEFRHDDVFRRVEFPVALEVDQITASFRNGLLRIVAPKAAEPVTDVEVSTAA